MVTKTNENEMEVVNIWHCGCGRNDHICPMSQNLRTIKSEKLDKFLDLRSILELLQPENGSQELSQRHYKDYLESVVSGEFCEM